MKRLAVFILSLFGLFLVTASVFASTEFETSYSTRYEVDLNGVTHVKQSIGLTNKLANVYATRYSLSLQGTQIQNVVAYDSQGALKTELHQENDQTRIDLLFNEKVVGKGKTLNFSLAYDTYDLAKKTGQVWGVTVPRLSDPSQIDRYDLTLAIPQSFGQLAFISPNPVSQDREGDFLTYHFTKNQLSASGVSAAFGQFQIFDFVLTYHLENPHLSLGVTEIALPPDTAYQRLFYQKIEPLPEEVKIDPDGNWLAVFKLGPGEKVEVTAAGKAKLFAQPQENFLLPSQEILKQNLTNQPYWQVDDPLIQAKAAELKTAENIYDFVIETLDYDFSRVEEGNERLGALRALEEPDRAICMEFTDLFIALTRAAGIPAREINGYAYTTNSELKPLNLVADVLHSWPEYWDEERQLWVPIDPTWAETTSGVDFFNKTDLNHFVFAIHGRNSEEPYPAGSYKPEDNLTKDVQVVFGQYEVETPPEIKIEFDLPSAIFFEIGAKGKILVKNLGPSAVYNLPLNLETEELTLKTESEATLAILPPFGQAEIPLQLTSPLFQFGDRSVTISLNGHRSSHSLKVRSLILERVLPGVVILSLLTFSLVRVKNKLRRR